MGGAAAADRTRRESRPTANFGGTGQCITEQSQYPDICYDLIAAGNLTAEGNLFDFERGRSTPPTSRLRAAGAAGAVRSTSAAPDRRAVRLGGAGSAAVQPVARTSSTPPRRWCAWSSRR